jgi:hypothetical protein
MSLTIFLSTEVDTGGKKPYCVDLFNINITHNLGIIANAIGLYYCLWRPEERGRIK